MTHIVHVPLSEGRDYKIHIGAGLLSRVGELVGEVARSRRAVIISQDVVARHWGARIIDSLKTAGFSDIPLLTFASGEKHKHLRTVERLCEGLYHLTPAIDRKTLIIALGGGVVGDVAGFVASLYLRGLDYVQVPTTLLAMVDSSVGGKTGVDFHAGKNLIGAFHQPRAVWIDTETLSTLPGREVNAGIAEVIKYGVIQDPSLLNLLSEHPALVQRRDSATIAQIVMRSCEIKADVVTKDEFETTGLRAILNYGHTVGHAIESITAYKRYKHGEAIAIGMVAAAYIGEAQGMTPPDIAPTLATVLSHYGLPLNLPSDISPESLLPLLSRDKKAENGRANFVLARHLGAVELVSGIEEATILHGLRRISVEVSGR